jgi:hypothetical protein
MMGTRQGSGWIVTSEAAADSLRREDNEAVRRIKAPTG